MPFAEDTDPTDTERRKWNPHWDMTVATDVVDILLYHPWLFSPPYSYCVKMMPPLTMA
jgi:hypothetical protein